MARATSYRLMPGVVISERISSARALTASGVAWAAAESTTSSAVVSPSPSSTVTASTTVTVTGASARLPAASSAQ